MSGLQRASGRIRRMTHEAVALRNMPRLRFELDRSLKKQAEVFQAIDRGVGRSGNTAENETEAEINPSPPDAAKAEPDDR